MKTMGIVVVAAFAGNFAALFATITPPDDEPISRQRRQMIVLPLRPAILDSHVTVLRRSRCLSSPGETARAGIAYPSADAP